MGGPTARNSIIGIGVWGSTGEEDVLHKSRARQEDAIHNSGGAIGLAIADCELINCKVSN